MDLLNLNFLGAGEWGRVKKRLFFKKRFSRLADFKMTSYAPRRGPGRWAVSGKGGVRLLLYKCCIRAPPPAVAPITLVRPLSQKPPSYKRCAAHRAGLQGRLDAGRAHSSLHPVASSIRSRGTCLSCKD